MNTASPHILLESRDGIVILELNRPPANAFCMEFVREFETTLGTKEVTEAKALVLTGSGRFFSGGLDLKVLPAYSRSQQREFLGVLNRIAGRLYGWPVPVVAGINGHAIAAGFILVLATDYRVGPTSDARFGLTEARVGIPFPIVPMIILRAELAPSNVRYTTLSAHIFGPDEARSRGVFDELQPVESVRSRAIEVARDMASMPADGYRRIKHQVRKTAIRSIDEAIASGSDPMFEEWLGPQTGEAAAAVLKGPKAR